MVKPSAKSPAARSAAKQVEVAQVPEIIFRRLQELEAEIAKVKLALASSLGISV